jgi:hypothetical protein
MRVIVDFYFDDLEQRCLNPDCDFVVGPYSEEWHGSCPGYIIDKGPCRGQLGFFRAFGTEAERSKQVCREDARIGGRGY